MNTPGTQRQRRTLEALLVLAVFAGVDLFRIAQSLPRPQFGDEWRYLYHANNLLHGYFSPRDRIFLLNGPIYPLTLTPFVSADWLDGARYLNALWHAGAMAYAWLILRAHVHGALALGALVLLGLYPPLDEHLPLLYTEALSCFLATAWIYHSLNAVTSLPHRMAAGAFLALLVLTKVAFGPVLTVFLAVTFVAWLRRPSVILQSYLTQAGLAFVLCIPYLAYTYHLTGRIFYWSSAGANNFYWLTSPYPDEWGDWYHQGWVYGDPMLSDHHKDIFDRTTGLAENPNLSEEEQLFNLSTPQSSDLFFDRGLRNVREHPMKFVRNWCGNVVRLFLDVPVSVRGTPFWNVYSISHLPLLAWTAFVAVYARRHRVRFPSAWTPIAGFGLLALAAYSLVSSMSRFLMPLVPVWWLGTCCWLAGALAGAPAGQPRWGVLGRAHERRA